MVVVGWRNNCPAGFDRWRGILCRYVEPEPACTGGDPHAISNAGVAPSDVYRDQNADAGSDLCAQPHAKRHAFPDRRRPAAYAGSDGISAPADQPGRSDDDHDGSRDVSVGG